MYLRAACRTRRGSNAAQETAKINMQRRACRTASHEAGIDISREFVDRGVAGPACNRLGFTALLAYIKKHPDIRYCLTADWNCLTRNVAEANRLRRLFDDAGVSLVSTSELPAVLNGMDG